jgi:hypothetical protein
MPEAEVLRGDIGVFMMVSYAAAPPSLRKRRKAYLQILRL